MTPAVRHHGLPLILLCALAGGWGCSSGDEPSSSANPQNEDDPANTDTDGGPDPMAFDPDGDPNGVLAMLSFASAEDDARHRCLLTTFDEDARDAGLRPQAPNNFRGTVAKTWCDTSGMDTNECARGLLDNLTLPGARARAVWATLGDDDSVATFGYRGVRHPEPEADGDWSIDFERTFGASDTFEARFVPFDGGAKDTSRRLTIFSVAGFGTDGVSVSLEPTMTPEELLAALSESPARFEQLLNERYDSLLGAFETRLRDVDVALDEAGRASALETATTRLNADRELAIANAAELQPLLAEQAALDRCGG